MPKNTDDETTQQDPPRSLRGRPAPTDDDPDAAARVKAQMEASRARTAQRSQETPLARIMAAQKAALERAAGR